MMICSSFIQLPPVSVRVRVPRGTGKKISHRARETCHAFVGRHEDCGRAGAASAAAGDSWIMQDAAASIGIPMMRRSSSDFHIERTECSSHPPRGGCAAMARMAALIRQIGADTAAATRHSFRACLHLCRKRRPEAERARGGGVIVWMRHTGCGSTRGISGISISGYSCIHASTSARVSGRGRSSYWPSCQPPPRRTCWPSRPACAAAHRSSSPCDRATRAHNNTGGRARACAS